MFADRYRIVRCLAAGGMAAVYEVFDARTERKRALKVLLPSLIKDPEVRGRFRREARVTGAIESEHIVETSDAGIDADTGAPFLVMELLRGEDLAAVVERRGPLPPSEVVALLFQAALGLDKMHGAGIVHRDVKPENLFLTARDDGSPRVKLIDFGIAKMIVEANPTNATGGLGTPIYMAPEQIHGGLAISPKTDLYALGQIAFTLLAGQPYWAEETRGAPTIYPALLKVAMGAEEPATARAARSGVEIPEAFDAWFAKATAPDPEQRFGSAASAILALAEALGVEAPRAPPPARDGEGRHATLTGVDTPSRLAAMSSRPRARRAGAAVVAVLAIGLGIYAVRSSAGTSAAPAPSAPAAPSRDREGVASSAAARPSEAPPAASAAAPPAPAAASPAPSAIPAPSTSPGARATGGSSPAKPAPTAPARTGATPKGKPPPRSIF